MSITHSGLMRNALLCVMLTSGWGCTAVSLQLHLLTAKQRWQSATCLEHMPSLELEAVDGPVDCKGGANKRLGCHVPGLARIDTAESDKMVAWTVLHEYGHELAIKPFQHISAGNGVMAADMSSATEYLTASDITFVCTNRPCRCSKPENP